ncbi:MAG: TIGR03960 family B12-binding radical SAM protein [Endomicrobium sp.]|nr:TIGR03960 family B12-binding radical SAM protein [Endomicrobium sp.]
MEKLSQLDEILSCVRKPARYIGCELNSHPADMSADFSVVLCFPDIYEVGASNLGLEILYHLINEKKLARCERVFAPDDDLELLLRKYKVDLFSLESKSALKSFDILGFTIQCELVATNIVNVLDLSGISIFSRKRKDDEPLVIGGGPVLTNPEPFCDFFDLFVLGDGEEAMEEIVNVCRRLKSVKFTKFEILKELSNIDGVYVPMFYNIEYNEDNTIKCVVPVHKNVKTIIKKNVVNIEDAYFPLKKIIPFVKIIHDRLNIEVARGCPGRCRFCQASKYYGPWRHRTYEKLLHILREGLQATGFKEVTFSSLSCSDYKYLDKLLIETNDLYGDSNLNISLPSLRCEKYSVKIAQYINRIKRPTLTFAPEAGTDRMRNVIGKYLSEKQIIETLLIANAMGWKVVKLYFMIGLPTETDDDISEIGRLVRFVKGKAKALNFNVSVSPFVPKAQTPFQWSPMADIDDIKRKTDILNNLLPANIKVHNCKTSILEALLAKGDRRLSSLIYKAWQKGAKFDQWTEKFNSYIWDEAIAETNIDLNFYIYRNIKFEEILPWDHLDFGVPKDALYREYIKGINETVEDNKSDSADLQAKDTCGGCISSVAQSDMQQILLPENYVEPKVLVNKPVVRLRFRFSKKGILRFISHLEQIRLFRKLARRSGLPIAFTAGFSPKVKSSYGPPLSVGHESSSEYIELYFTKKVYIEDVRSSFLELLPVDFKLLSIKRVPLIFPNIDVLSNVAEYEIKNVNISQKKLDEFLSQSLIMVEKAKKDKVIEIDVKPLIRSFKNEDNVLKLQLRFGNIGHIKPESVLKKLLEGNQKSYSKTYAIERTNLYVETKNGKIHEL